MYVLLTAGHHMDKSQRIHYWTDHTGKNNLRVLSIGVGCCHSWIMLMIVGLLLVSP